MAEKKLPLGRMIMNSKYTGKKQDYSIYYKLIAGLMLFLLGVSVIINGYFHTKAEGLSVAGPLQAADDLVFLTDLTYMHAGETYHEQMIFSEMISMIESAENFIVADFFLFNDGYDRSAEYPDLTKQFSDALIARKQSVPDLTVILITDEINNFYGAYEAAHLTRLKESGVDVVITDLSHIGNSNPLYTGVWSSLIRPFGSGDQGLLQNPFGDLPRVTLRGYLKLLNFKANHRKVLVTENAALVTSANPHDASAYHSNIAFRFSGPLAADLLATEKTVAAFSGFDMDRFPSLPVVDVSTTSLQSETSAMVITEGKIKEHLLEEIGQTQEGDTIWMGQFYIGDRQIVGALIEAAGRDVTIRMILDPNKDAFGRTKKGIPNRPVASELVRESEEAIEIRWYNTNGEQYHTKLTLIHQAEKSIIIGGSANYTKRNIGDKNLETNLKVITPRNSNLSNEVNDYFRRIWSNRAGQYTLRYEDFEDQRAWRHWLYRFQEWSGFSTF